MADYRNQPRNPLRERVLGLLESDGEDGGPQSVDDVCRKLKISNTNSRSVLVRLNKKGLIERVEKGVYRAKGDKREYKKS